MYIDDAILSFEEDLSLRLRALFQNAGFRRYQMGKFEAYDLYAQFRDFLGSESIISFTDTNGKLMALKPDVTLFYAANNKVEPATVEKVYYNENVYRVSKSSGSFKEIMQVGVECLGDIAPKDVQDCLELAVKSLETISPEYMMAVTSLDVMSEALGELQLPSQVEAQVKRFIADKNLHGLKALLASQEVAPEAAAKLMVLLNMPQDAAECVAQLNTAGFNREAVATLEAALGALKAAGFAQRVRIDFSLVNDTAYYNGLAFQGFVQGVPRAVLMGGQYDNLLQKLGRAQRGVGFAVYMDGIRSAR